VIARLFRNTEQGNGCTPMQLAPSDAMRQLLRAAGKGASLPASFDAEEEADSQESGEDENKSSSHDGAAKVPHGMRIFVAF
jgi:hypothetical protein